MAAKWSEDELELLREWHPLEGTTCCSRFEGRTKSSVKWKASRLGIKSNDSKRGQHKKTNTEYDSEIKGRHFIRLGEYIRALDKLAHKCSVCEYEWEARPNDILNGSGCPRCSGQIVDADIVSLYLIKITTASETFLKLGVSSNMNRRLREIKNKLKATVELLHSIEDTAKTLIPLEKKILRDSNLIQHKPEVKFCGHTECLHVDELDRVLALMQVTQLGHLQPKAEFAQFV